MLSQELPAQLQFEDLSMNFDYPRLQRGGQASSEPSSSSSDRPRMSISSIVNPASVPMIGDEYSSTSTFGQTTSHMADPHTLWPTFTGLCDYHTSQNYQTTQGQLSADCEPSMAYDFNSSSMDGQPFAYNFPYDYTIDETSLSCPRSYRSGFDTNSAEHLTQSTEAYPPSSYLMDPQKHQSYMTILSHPTQDCTLNTGNDCDAGNHLQFDYGSRDDFYSCPSPALSSLSSHYEKVEPQASPQPARDGGSEGFDNISVTGDDPDDGEDDGNQPYAKLIYKALMSAPEKRMVLNEIYDWFRKTYDKFNTMKTKGWQNSIRHNLSMNGAFTKMEKTDDSSKGFIWVLEPSAIREGVKSTTRYRKVTATKKSLKTENAMPRRQSSMRRGVKPGKKGLKSTKLRRTERAAAMTTAAADVPASVIDPPITITTPSPLPHLPPSILNDQQTWSYYDGLPVVPAPRYIKQEQTPYLFQDVIGVSTNYSDEPFFCDASDDGGLHVDYPCHEPIANTFYSHQDI